MGSTDIDLHLTMQMFSYSDVPLFRISTDFRIFGRSVKKIIFNCFQFFYVLWELLGDKRQPSRSCFRSF